MNDQVDGQIHFDLDTIRFDGATYEPDLDKVRLTSQIERVRKVMLDYQWHTLEELERLAAPGTQAAISARLRDLRKPRFGGHNVQHERIDGGLFRYRIVKDES